MSNKIGLNSSIFYGFRLTLLFCIILCTKETAAAEQTVQLDPSKEVPAITTIKTHHIELNQSIEGLKNVSEDIKVSNSSVTDALEKIPPPEDNEDTKSTIKTDELPDNQENTDSKLKEDKENTKITIKTDETIKPKDIVDDTNPNKNNNILEVIPNKEQPNKEKPEKDPTAKETPGESQTEKNGIISETDKIKVSKDVEDSEDAGGHSEDVNVDSKNAESESTHDKISDEKVDSNENINKEPDNTESGSKNDFSGVLPKTDIPPDGDDESNFSFFRLFIVVSVFFVLMYVGYYHRHILLKHFSRDKSEINYHPLRTMQHNAVD